MYRRGYTHNATLNYCRLSFNFKKTSPMKFLRLTLPAVLLLISLSSSAQQLASQYHIKAASSAYHRITRDASGNTYVYGTFDDLDGKNQGRLLKLDAAGDFVSGFQKIYADAAISDVVIQPDGKILISGEFTKINSQPVAQIVRLNANGTIDPAFTSALAAYGDMELQTTGKIIVLTNGGTFERLNSNGSIDQSFNFQNFLYGSAQYEIAPDNSIFFSNHNIVHKLTPDGADDNSFQIGTGVEQSYISALEVQSDGKVLAGGYFTKYNGVDAKSIVRLNTNGTVDNTFSTGNNIEGQLFQIVQRSNGKILIGGQFYAFGGQSASLVELNTDGTLSRNIAVVYTNNITTISEGNDSKITISGEFNSVNGFPMFGTARFNSNYTMDQTFAPKVSYNNSNGLHIVVDDAMKATIMGDYQFFGIYKDNNLVKGKMFQVSALGAYEPAFKPNFTYASVFDSYVQTDGKVIVTGGFGNASWEVLRLNSDGSKDPSFNIGSGPTFNGVSTALYNVSKIGDLYFLGGSFTHFNGTPSQSLVAVNTSGALIKTFTSLPVNCQVNKVVAQSDGKIIVTGYFKFSSTDVYIVRLKADGSIDETFHRPTLLQSPSDIAIDAQDNIYLSGESLHPDGSLLKSLIKLTPDGFVDGTFSIGSGLAPWGYVTALQLLPDGKIAIGGHFDTVQGVEQPGFAILDANGTLIPQEETFFGKGSAAVGIFYKNQQLFLAGKFRTRDYTEAYSFVKVLLNDVALPAAPTNLAVTLTAPGALSVSWTDNSTDRLAFVIERAVDDLSNFVALDTVAANVKQFADQITRSHTHAYRVRAINDAGYSNYSNVDALKWAPAPEGTVTLTVAAPTSAQANLTWQGAILYHDGFIVEYTTGTNSIYTALDTLPVTSTTFAHTIVRNTQYRYRVKAYNEAGSSLSQTVVVEWLPLPQGSLSLTLANPEEGKAVLSWTHNIVLHDGFIIERSLQSNTGYVAIDTVATTANSFTDLTDGKNSHYYRVSAYNVNGVVVSNKVSLIITGIETVSESEIRVYPNPAKEYVVVSLDDATSGATMSVVDRDGRVLSCATHLSQGSQRVDLAGLAPGVYLVRLSINGKVLTKRIVKE
jgi:uncharacterized delta-60 repeat protein